MSESLVFDQVFRSLNPAQKTAVQTTDGPVMVIAGPGTGKTQILAARIANILLTTDTNPSSILALTFTESAATNMRERLVSMIGKTGYYVHIQTFHAFCSEVISAHPEYFSIDRESQPLTDLERFQLFESIFSELDLELLKPINAPFFYLKDSMKAISDLKREGVSLSEFNVLIEAEQELLAQESESLKKGELVKRQKLIAKNLELTKIYHAYQDSLKSVQRYDYEDMITLVKLAFAEHQDLLLEYQEKLLYFLVDEYQDTNSAQNQVVDLLTSYWGDAANIFVVGDPNQAIYRFQGASIENVLSFTQRYPTATVISLNVGYRSPQRIYTAAADLIKENQLSDISIGQETNQVQLNQTLQSIHPDGEYIQIYQAPSQTLEAVYVAERIKQLLSEKVQAQEIAVLYRNNADSTDFAQALSKWGIKYAIDGGNNVLEEAHICQLLSLLKVIQAFKNGSDDSLLFEVMQYDWVAVEPLLVMKAARAANKARVSLAEVVLKGYSFFQEYELTKNVSAKDFAQLELFLERVQQWGVQSSNLILTSWLELVMTESGFLPWVLAQPDKINLLNGVNSFYREVVAQVELDKSTDLGRLLAMIETLQEHNLSITKEDLNVEQDAVHLSTVHKAKGQEWQHVFLVRCIDGKWGNTKQRNVLPLPAGVVKNTDLSGKEQNEDDRRLFYVALTRTKQMLHVSYPETIITGNRSKSAMGSIFIEEIKPHTQVVTGQQTESITTRADEFLARLIEPAVPVSRSSEERAFFTQLTRDMSLSVTALNTYLRSPQQFIEDVLLRVPRAVSPYFAFGTAVHRALETWNRSLSETKSTPPLEVILNSFEQSLAEQPLSADEFEVRKKHGLAILSAYYEENSHRLEAPLFIERQFGYGFHKAYLQDVSLSGRVDRVDWISQADKTVRVIDYKTGKTKTTGEIEGQTVSADLSEREKMLPETIRGPYKRQLLFYKLLTELDPSFEPKVVAGNFEFVEPDKQSGKFVSRSFTLDDEAVQDLKKLILEVMSEIRTLAFLDQS